MSRSGYHEDCENLDLYRHSVERAIKGKRGQAFLCELADALDAMPVKRLIAEHLIDDVGEVCAIGAVCKARGIDLGKVYEDDSQSIADAVGIARALAAEIAWMNDEENYDPETPEQRWVRMREWVRRNIEGS